MSFGAITIFNFNQQNNIKQANPDGKTISHLANEWGFWSMGHFSQDYKKLFGESPCQHWKKN